ncbi:MAG: hypothetical protein ACLQU1_36360 [Bryobacteraceae bacterium]
MKRSEFDKLEPEDIVSLLRAEAGFPKAGRKREVARAWDGIEARRLLKESGLKTSDARFHISARTFSRLLSHGKATTKTIGRFCKLLSWKLKQKINPSDLQKTRQKSRHQT